MRSLVQRSVLLVILSVACAAMGHAQVRFFASQPNIDSFPVVRIGVGVTVNGIAATDLQASNFTVTSDGAPVNGVELVGCDAPVSAAIAIVVDTSASMKMSVGTGTAPNFSYTAFRDCFSRLISRVPLGSYFTVVPFGDSATYSYPNDSRLFYRAAVDTDTTELESVLRSLKFDSAGTYVDAGVSYASQLLKSASVDRRAIILVTDDYIDDETAITALLQRSSISLYVMQVRPDSGIVILPNREVARATSGDYLEAPDSSSYGPIMSSIADKIFSTRCTLRYLDTSPCPWLTSHDVSVTLNYNLTRQTAKLQYSLGPNIHDTARPRIQTDSTLAFKRVAIGLKDYPCESALRAAQATALQNFKAGKATIHPDSGWLPLSVIDTMYEADGDVTFIDMLGNEATIHVRYVPKADTIAPQFDPPVDGGGAYQVRVREAKGWDRGIRSVVLDPTATNIILDYLKYYKKDSAFVELHVHDLTQPVDGCLIATDSAGNVSRLCLTYTPTAADTLPPVLAADALSEPRKKITGLVTEHRLNDTGIRDVLLSPGSNTTNGAQTIMSTRETRVSADLVDSLYPAVLYVRATDSAGNEIRDSLIYSPLPDSIGPDVQYTTGSATVQLTASEVAPWDRGLHDVSIEPGAVNASLTTSAFVDARHWAGSLTITDPTQDASFIVLATDSAMNVSRMSIVIPATPLQAPDYMGDSIVDFGTHFLPISMRKSIIIRNTNAFAMTVSVVGPVGDDSVFSMVQANTFPLSARNAEELEFNWNPHITGHWRAVYTLYSGADKIGTITVIGVSVGLFGIEADTVAALPGTTGKSLHVRITSKPAVLNVDTIQFTLTYDPNVVSFFNVSNCTGSSSLCPYSLVSTPTASGLRISLSRPSHGPAIPFDYANAVITLPLQTYISVDSSTTIGFRDIYTSAGEVTDTIDGRVIALDMCGSPELRRYLQEKPLLEIKSVTPNPTSGSVVVTVQASTEELAKFEWVTATGAVAGIEEVQLRTGVHPYTLSSTPASGSYSLVLTLSNGARSVWRTSVIR